MQSDVTTMGAVLIADDDVTLSSAWQELLLDAGFDVATATTGLKALDRLRNGSRVDVMLLDYKMPELNGAQTLEQLKDEFPEVKTIGITGVESSQVPSAFRDGVQKLLEKPVRASDLVEAVSSVIDTPVALQTETVNRSMSWVSFSLFYALFLASSLGILYILRRAVSEILSSQ